MPKLNTYYIMHYILLLLELFHCLHRHSLNIFALVSLAHEKTYLTEISNAIVTICTMYSFDLSTLSCIIASAPVDRQLLRVDTEMLI